MDEETLSGLRILVTRSAGQAGKLSDRLRQLKAEVFELPVIAIDPPDSWESLDNALTRLADYQWMVFASVNAVESVLSRLKELGQSPETLQATKLAAIGPATSDALKSAGLNPAFSPAKFIAEALIEEFPGYPDLHGLSVLWPRTNVGRDYISQKLQDAGATVEIVHCYKTSLPADSQELARQLVSLLGSGKIDVVTLTSSQSARNLAALLDPHDKDGLIRPVAIACIGPETASAARESLGKVDVQSQTYTVDGLVDAVCAWHRAKTSGAERIN